VIPHQDYIKDLESGLEFRQKSIEEIGITPVDENSPIPLYHQVHMDLLNLLQSSKLQPGDMLPTEKILSEAYHVGRQTLREAVARLVNENLLERTQGRGTVVLAGQNRLKFFLDRSFAKQMIEMGLTPHSEVLRINRGQIDETSHSSLHSKIGSDSLELIRLRFGDDTPIGVQYTTIITDACLELGDEDFENESLYSLLLTKYRLPITRIDQVVRAALADEWHKSLLKISGTAPLLLVHTTAYLDNNEPIEASTSYYKADKYEFSIVQNY
jgi:GntR family transcriptional regulator